MTRVCFTLRVRPDRLEEYLARHSPVPADMLAEIHAAGRRDYSLFVAPDGLLVGYYETDDDEAARAYLATSPVATAWEAEMAPFFAGLEGRPDQTLPLTEVFNLADQLSAASPESTAS
ncbi:L-rhamnose mutarotase [Microbacterium gorillae]|uniref:L-rhamnose mutarotase n=1 Tax=Microbacterium gorillae TaxID=1231063 RepID=UPI00059126EC|nr:L-rhamnose mutarotase [Microbacterium gorillae]